MPTTHPLTLAVSALLLLSTGCRDSESPNEPARTSLEGGWSGFIDTNGCDGAVRLEISQGTRLLNGRWESTSAIPGCGNRGSVGGEVQGNDVTIQLFSEVHFACVIIVDATRRGENRLAGRFERSRCTSAGVFEVARDE